MEEINRRNKLGYELSHRSFVRNLSFQNLKSVPGDIFHFKYITILNLNNNFITQLPDNIKDLKNLLFLNLSHNQLVNLPQSLCEVYKLKYLNISNNKFSEIPSVLLESLQFLTDLILSRNEIKYFTDPPSSISNLVELNLSHNKLMEIPTWIFSFKCSIKIFDISNNELIRMNEEFLNGNVLLKLVTKIHSLNLENCGLSSEKLRFLSNMTALTCLKLGNDNMRDAKSKNALDNLKFEIFEKSINLKEIYLNNVRISVLENNLDCFMQLQYIDLEGNFLLWLPDSFCELKSLEICNLSRNMISFLPEQFGKLINLKYLYLNNNNIAEIPSSFSALVNLEYCDFYGNKLEYINSSLINMKSLRGIDLENNCLNFNSIFEDEETYNHLISKYSVMKEHYRKMMNKKRYDLQILETYESSYLDDEHDDESSDDECYTPTNVSVSKNPVFLENWDEDQNEEPSMLISSDVEHDDFDPNVNYDTKFQCMRKNEGNAFSSNFCPADIHIPTLKKYFLRDSQEMFVVEGQFDMN